MAFFPFALIVSEEQIYSIGILGMKEVFGQQLTVYPVWGFIVLLEIIVVLSIVTLFSFKWRMRQIRLCVFNICLLVGFYAFFFYFLMYVVKVQFTWTTLNIKFILALPFVAIVLNFLAIRSIGADEALMRSLNRLR